jgi:hypothetical protein
VAHIGTPHTHGAGYFVNDKELRTRQEADIQTCSHCDAIIKMQEWVKKGAFCRTCMKPICHSPCGDRLKIYGCECLMKRLDQAFDANLKIEKYLKMLEPDAPVEQVRIITGV